jgi:ribosomal protein S18 acetylase RimI-like enzyme
MTIKTKNNRQVVLRKLTLADYDNLFLYLDNLSLVTKKRFGPHPFDKQSILDFYQKDKHRGYVAHDPETLGIVAYSIINIGYLEDDGYRLQSYGLTLDDKTDCTFAPSVADSWQGCGIGNSLFKFIVSDLKLLEIKRIILWAGVQASNDKAVNYYKKNGFQTLGEFYNHNGKNYDMVLNLD